MHASAKHSADVADAPRATRCPSPAPAPAAPQYGSAKDVINLAGMVAANVLRGDHPVVHWDQVDWAAVAKDPGALIVDVREVRAWCSCACPGLEGAAFGGMLGLAVCAAVSSV